MQLESLFCDYVIGRDIIRHESRELRLSFVPYSKFRLT